MKRHPKVETEPHRRPGTFTPFGEDAIIFRFKKGHPRPTPGTNRTFGYVRKDAERWVKRLLNSEEALDHLYQLCELIESGRASPELILAAAKQCLAERVVEAMK